ncbi:hypothetical protein DFH08DRAFT_1034462 [Mycena albidolilacea]|uniref:Uncharacterized protein n=1 Tax=Mycena albidolilacea TaxID=1033008 RepID=A0AAD7EGW2_9AGAR|nr:hypothetical protein DFH08DRAFT_1034462 [Mycena albidolilacea]
MKRKGKARKVEKEERDRRKWERRAGGGRGERNGRGKADKEGPHQQVPAAVLATFVSPFLYPFSTLYAAVASGSPPDTAAWSLSVLRPRPTLLPAQVAIRRKRHRGAEELELEYVVKDWQEEDGPRASTSATSPTKNTRRISRRICNDGGDKRRGSWRERRRERGTESRVSHRVAEPRDTPGGLRPMASHPVAPRDRGDKIWKEVKAVEPERLVKSRSCSVVESWAEWAECPADGVVESEYHRTREEVYQHAQQEVGSEAPLTRFILSILPTARACTAETVSASWVSRSSSGMSGEAGRELMAIEARSGASPTGGCGPVDERRPPRMSGLSTGGAGAITETRTQNPGQSSLRVQHNSESAGRKAQLGARQRRSSTKRCPHAAYVSRGAGGMRWRGAHVVL